MVQTIEQRQAKADKSIKKAMAGIRAEIALEEFIREENTKLVQYQIDQTMDQVDVRQLRNLIASSLGNINPCIAWAVRDLNHDLNLFIIQHFQRTGMLLGTE